MRFLFSGFILGLMGLWMPLSHALNMDPEIELVTLGINVRQNDAQISVVGQTPQAGDYIFDEGDPSYDIATSYIFRDVPIRTTFTFILPSKDRVFAKDSNDQTIEGQWMVLRRRLGFSFGMDYRQRLFSLPVFVQLGLNYEFAPFKYVLPGNNVTKKHHLFNARASLSSYLGAGFRAELGAIAPLIKSKKEVSGVEFTLEKNTRVYLGISYDFEPAN